MKRLTSLIVLLALFTVAFSWTAFFQKVEHLKEKGQEKLESVTPKNLDPTHHKGVDEFWTGVFDSFKLSKPTELINCFGTVSGPIFFRKIRKMSDLLMHSKGQDNLKLHTDYTQFAILAQALEHAHKCMAQTKDFERLTDSLDVSKDLEVLKKMSYLYFEAKFAQIADEFRGVIHEIDGKEYNKAGKKYAEMLKKAVKDFSSQGEELIAYQAFSNGVTGTLSLPLPSQNLNCYSSKDAKPIMDFYRGLAHAVAEGKFNKADESAASYWEKEGKTLLEKIPKKVMTCESSSNESKQLSDKLGVDIHSKDFRDKMWNYMKNHNIMFYSYLKTMNAAFGKNDNLHAGSAYAHLLEAVSKSS